MARRAASGPRVGFGWAQPPPHGGRGTGHTGLRVGDSRGSYPTDSAPATEMAHAEGRALCSSPGEGKFGLPLGGFTPPPPTPKRFQHVFSAAAGMKRSLRGIRGGSCPASLHKQDGTAAGVTRGCHS